MFLIIKGFTILIFVAMTNCQLVLMQTPELGAYRKVPLNWTEKKQYIERRA